MFRFLHIFLMLFFLVGCKSTSKIKSWKSDISASQIDIEKGKPILKKKFKLDTISVVATAYDNKIEAIFKMNSMKDKLTGEFYFKNDTLFFSHFAERSSIYSNDDSAFVISDFTFKNNVVIEETSSMFIPSVLMCIAIPSDPSKLLGYDINLNLEFLKQLISQVLREMKV